MPASLADIIRAAGNTTLGNAGGRRGEPQWQARRRATLEEQPDDGGGLRAIAAVSRWHRVDLADGVEEWKEVFAVGSLGQVQVERMVQHFLCVCGFTRHTTLRYPGAQGRSKQLKKNRAAIPNGIGQERDGAQQQTHARWLAGLWAIELFSFCCCRAEELCAQKGEREWEKS